MVLFTIIRMMLLINSEELWINGNKMSLLKKIGMSLASFGLAFAFNLEAKLFAKDIYVPRDYPTIQSAIDANDTVDGDRILVALGVYDINEPVTYRGKNIALKSIEGPQNTIINGNYQTQTFTFNSGETNDAVLEGFTITRGNAWEGGGIYCGGSSPTIRYNIIIGNEAYSGGGIACVRGNPLIMSNVIYRNVGFSEAGGIYCMNSQTQILDNIIKENSVWDMEGGGIYCVGHSSLIIKGNYIVGNFAWEDGSGIFIANSEAIIEKNIIARNSTDEDGGGISGWYSKTYIIGNTITNNSTIYNGGGIDIFENIETILLNNIVYANTPADLSGIQPNQVFYSNISQEGFAGINGNISENPYFVNPNPDSNTLDDLIENGNFDGAMQYLKECYSLQPDSNCIDTGDPRYLLDPDGTRADIGAIYFDQDRNKFIRGDSNIDGKVDYLDAITLLHHLFENKKLECKDSADVDDNGKIDVNDVYYLCDYLYKDGNQPPTPFPEAGYDLTPDTLTCYVCKKCEDADINDDWKVNFSDYAIFANSWLEEGSRLGDIYEDNKINYKDLKNLADNWLWDFDVFINKYHDED